MRIVFMGTPDFAVASLNALVQSDHEIVCVVTATDKIGGRGRQTIITSAVKDRAVTLGIPVLQPDKLRDPAFLDTLQSLRADLFVVVAFRMLPQVVWSMPPRGTINLHGSLLPAYRGAAPIHWAVLNGEKETGVTIFFLQQEIDTGDLLHQERIPVRSDETTGSVYERMMYIGARALVRSLSMIESGRFKLFPQDEVDVSLAPKIFPETAELGFDWPIQKLVNWVRGMNPHPSAWFFLQDKILKVHAATSLHQIPDHPPGTLLLVGRELRIAAKDGWLIPKELQLEGRNRVSIQDFVNGMPLVSRSPGACGPLYPKEVNEVRDY
ncbi:MAG: methionyl-tRNA formyltransferase [Saprospiraceae bacterium]|nr:methionyl-tRNA formyltransferase [Saprospiraceae bacterium]